MDCRVKPGNDGMWARFGLKLSVKQKSPAENRGAFALDIVKEDVSVLGRPGSDLLFQALRLSTIGAEDFDGRVRDGIGYGLLAMTTRSAKNG
jgi:hypothetical protein